MIPSTRRQVTQRAIARNRALFPEPADAIDSILSTYAAATDDERRKGRRWYPDTREEALRLTGDAISGAGVIAALSPRTGWNRNVDAAWQLVEEGHAPAQTDLFNARALQCHRGEDPSDVLRGPKVRSFYRNISDPEHHGPVTIDRHAVSVIFGRKLSESEIKVLARRGSYVYAAAIYRAAARRLNLRPNVLQAIVWLAHRRIHGIVDSQTEMEEF